MFPRSNSARHPGVYIGNYSSSVQSGRSTSSKSLLILNTPKDSLVQCLYAEKCFYPKYHTQPKTNHAIQSPRYATSPEPKLLHPSYPSPSCLRDSLPRNPTQKTPNLTQIRTNIRLTSHTKLTAPNLRPSRILIPLTHNLIRIHIIASLSRQNEFRY